MSNSPSKGGLEKTKEQRPDAQASQPDGARETIRVPDSASVRDSMEQVVMESNEIQKEVKISAGEHADCIRRAQTRVPGVQEIEARVQKACASIVNEEFRTPLSEWHKERLGEYHAVWEQGPISEQRLWTYLRQVRRQKEEFSRHLAKYLKHDLADERRRLTGAEMDALEEELLWWFVNKRKEVGLREAETPMAVSVGELTISPQELSDLLADLRQRRFPILQKLGDRADERVRNLPIDHPRRSDMCRWRFAMTQGNEQLTYDSAGKMRRITQQVALAVVDDEKLYEQCFSIIGGIVPEGEVTRWRTALQQYRASSREAICEWFAKKRAGKVQNGHTAETSTVITMPKQTLWDFWMQAQEQFGLKGKQLDRMQAFYDSSRTKAHREMVSESSQRMQQLFENIVTADEQTCRTYIHFCRAEHDKTDDHIAQYDPEIARRQRAMNRRCFNEYERLVREWFVRKSVKGAQTDDRTTSSTPPTDEHTLVPEVQRSKNIPRSAIHGALRRVQQQMTLSAEERAAVLSFLRSPKGNAFLAARETFTEKQRELVATLPATPDVITCLKYQNDLHRAFNSLHEAMGAMGEPLASEMRGKYITAIDELAREFRTLFAAPEQGSKTVAGSKIDQIVANAFQRFQSDLNAMQRDHPMEKGLSKDALAPFNETYLVFEQQYSNLFSYLQNSVDHVDFVRFVNDLEAAFQPAIASLERLQHSLMSLLPGKIEQIFPEIRSEGEKLFAVSGDSEEVEKEASQAERTVPRSMFLECLNNAFDRLPSDPEIDRLVSELPVEVLQRTSEANRRREANFQELDDHLPPSVTYSRAQRFLADLHSVMHPIRAAAQAFHESLRTKALQRQDKFYQAAVEAVEKLFAPQPTS